MARVDTGGPTVGPSRPGWSPNKIASNFPLLASTGLRLTSRSYYAPAIGICCARPYFDRAFAGTVLDNTVETAVVMLGDVRYLQAYAKRATHDYVLRQQALKQWHSRTSTMR